MLNVEQIAELYRSGFFQQNQNLKAPEIKVEFYPYVGINSRIRIRDSWMVIRISDVLIDAPLEFHRALSQILIRKLFRKRVLKSDLEIYNDYLKQIHIQEKSVLNRRERGRKIITSSRGEIYDLDNIFVFLNQVYFENSLPKPTLTWSAKNTFRILGHHDSAHKTIAVSRSLDDKTVPRYVVEYVVYHEMLHIKHPTILQNGRRRNHTPTFRRDEREFAYFKEAEEWIEQNAAALKRKVRRRR